MKWFLAIYLFSSPDVLVREMSSKQECLKVQKELKTKTMKKIKDIESVSCEEGMILNTISNDEREDEVL